MVKVEQGLQGDNYRRFAQKDASEQEDSSIAQSRESQNDSSSSEQLSENQEVQKSRIVNQKRKYKTKMIQKTLVKAQKLRFYKGREISQKIEECDDSAQDEYARSYGNEPDGTLKKQEVEDEGNENSNEEMVDQAAEEDASEDSSQNQEEKEQEGDNVSSISSEQSREYESSHKVKVKREEQEQEHQLYSQQNKNSQQILNNRIDTRLSLFANQLTNIRVVLERIQSLMVFGNRTNISQLTPIILQEPEPTPQQPQAEKDPSASIVKMQSTEVKKQAFNHVTSNPAAGQPQEKQKVQPSSRERRKRKGNAEGDRIIIE